MPKLNILESLANKVWNGKYSKDVGESLIHLGALGWVLSSLAQITMLASNKDINKKEKKFLIPQECSDAAVNIGLYYTICQVIKNIGDYAVENVVFLTQKTNNLIKKINPDCRSTIDFVKGFGEYFRNIGLTKITNQRQNLSSFLDGAINYVKGENIPNNFTPPSAFNEVFDRLKTGLNKEQQLELLEDVQRNFKSYKNGVGVITAVGASVLACNIVTPIIRNCLANKFQKKLLTQQTQNKKTIIHTNKPKPANYTPQVSVYKSPVFDKFKIY